MLNFPTRIETKDGTATLTIAGYLSNPTTGSIVSAKHTETGDVIHIKNLRIDTIKDELICIECGGRLAPVRGEERAWHYRHYNDTSNTNGEGCASGESILHNAAKFIFKEGKEFRIPEMEKTKTVRNPAFRELPIDELTEDETLKFKLEWNWETDVWGKNEIPQPMQKINAVRYEKREEGYIPDVIVECLGTKNKREFLIEICVTHKVGAAKKSTIRKLKKESIEIFISRKDLEIFIDKNFEEYIKINGEEEASKKLEYYVLNKAPREWIYSPIGEKGDKLLEEIVRDELNTREEHIKKIQAEEERIEKKIIQRIKTAQEKREKREIEERKTKARIIIKKQNEKVHKEIPKEDLTEKFFSYLCSTKNISKKISIPHRFKNCPLIPEEYIYPAILDCMYDYGYEQSATEISERMIQKTYLDEGFFLPDGWIWDYVEQHLLANEEIDRESEIKVFIEKALEFMSEENQKILEKNAETQKFKIREESKNIIFYAKRTPIRQAIINTPIACQLILYNEKFGFQQYIESNHKKRADIRIAVEEYTKLILKKAEDRKIQDYLNVQKHGWIVLSPQKDDLISEKIKKLNETHAIECQKIIDDTLLVEATISREINEAMLTDVVENFEQNKKEIIYSQSQKERDRFIEDLKEENERTKNRLTIVLSAIKNFGYAINEGSNQPSPNYTGIDKQKFVKIKVDLQKLRIEDLLNKAKIDAKIAQHMKEVERFILIPSLLEDVCRKTKFPANIILFVIPSHNHDVYSVLKSLKECNSITAQTTDEDEKEKRNTLNHKYGIGIDEWLCSQEKEGKNNMLAKPYK